MPVALSAALPPLPPNAPLFDVLTHRFSTRVAGASDEAIDAAVHVMRTGSKSVLFGTLARWSAYCSGVATGDTRLSVVSTRRQDCVAAIREPNRIPDPSGGVKELSSQTRQRPDPGRSASKGLQKKERREPPKVGTTKREVDRVSPAGKVAQARKDAAKR